VRTTLPPPATDERTRLRLTFVAALLLSVFVVLVARLWFVQIVGGDRYQVLAERNRVRAVTLEAPRGRVLDRSGRVLVDNRQVHVIGVAVDEMGDRRNEVLADLARLLGTDVVAIDARIASAPVDPVRPVPVAFDVPERIALFVWEHQATRFPGVHAELVPRRSYPHGRLAAHVLGYTGEITPEQLGDSAYEGVDAGAQVGMAGVERSYDRVLRGAPGTRELEIDAAGDVVRQTSERLPTPGADLQLTIDLDIQRRAEQALATGIARARRQTDDEGRGDGRFAAPAGAIVVLDPRDGAVRAMASYPAFEPAAFVGGIDAAGYAALLDPAAHAPLVNRAVQATYPPGSVFKIVSAAAALRHRFATPRTEIACPGVWRWNGGGAPFRNWRSENLGGMTLSESLAQSCDTVYYELAKRMWEAEEQRGRTDELIGAEARRFGFGSASGIDLPAERAGVVPGRRWRRQFWEAHHDSYCAQAERATSAGTRRLLAELCSPAGAQWRGGDAVNLSIGQGDLQASPLQVAVSMAAIANAGAVPSPHVGSAVIAAGGAQRAVAARSATALDLEPQAMDAIRQGLQGVTAAGGTAAAAFSGAAPPVAGKTGTAEAGANQPFAWFAGYGPTTGARHVVVAVIEQGGSGSASAAPIAREVFDGLAALEGRD
jgi:penicillin-binding protein 2